MGAFEYQVLDAGGRERKGVMEGDTARQIRQQLRDKGWTPLSVEAVEQREARQKGGFSLRRGINATELALVTRQLATLVQSGMPVESALATAAEQSEKMRLKKIILAVRAKVLEGHTLADALKEFPHVFPDLYRSTVAAGEHSGHLEAVLGRLADYTESRQALSQKMGLAMIYPALMIIVAILVVVVLLAYVVPQVVGVFDNIGQELPLLTRGLIAVSDFLSAWGIALFVLIVVSVTIFNLLLRREGFRSTYHRWLLRLPLVGRLVRGLNTARFARTFSILSASGVPVLEGMRIAAEVVSNLPMRKAVDEAARRVREGTPINRALQKSGYFPPMVVHLIASGEASGNLDEMLERAATSQERELETAVSALMGILEPALILVMGVVVLVIVLAILLPIFDMNQLVH
ncbi:MAG TPA: type II secretion system protein GspF [Gammaproteobacteria bacterium]|nr:type II secretion system protein GspF [Gammaproteobacteria bacterium]